VFDDPLEEFMGGSGIDLRPGKLFDGHRIIRKLGQGGMGVVFEAIEPGLGRHVAIKILPRSLTGEHQLLARFNREARMLSKMDHPNIVKIYGLGSAMSHHYFTMELVTGSDLSQILAQKGRLELSDALRVMWYVCHALNSAHRLNIIHRDIKPPNVLISADREIKVSDFGLAKTLGAATQVTVSGQLIGTPLYFSPEYAKGEKVDTRTDIYSAGVMFYEMLTGKPAHLADTPLAVIRKVIDEDVPSVLDTVSNIPTNVDRLIIRATAKNPDERYTDIMEMLGDIDRCLKGKTVTLHRTKISDQIRNQQQLEKKRSIRRLGALIAMLGIIVSCSTFLFSSLAEYLTMENASEARLDWQATVRKKMRAQAELTQMAELKEQLGKPTVTGKPVQLVLPLGFTPKDGARIDAKTGLPLAVLCDKDGSEMVLVPSGGFVMGSSQRNQRNCYPAHTVKLSAFYIDRLPVTQANYLKYLSGADNPPPAPNKLLRKSLEKGTSLFPEVAELPIRVTWSEANTYCQWARKRLATEAQWEKTARSDDQRTYPWGEDAADPSRGNFELRTMPVGSFPHGASPYGCLDLAGNGAEWCFDFYHEKYYTLSPNVEPLGPSDGLMRVIRDGVNDVTWRSGAMPKSDNHTFRGVMIPKTTESPSS